MTTKSIERAASGQTAVSPVPHAGFLVDYEAAIRSYIDDYVSITIDRVDFPDTALNTDEEGKYEVVVHNAGSIRMRNVSMRFRGLNGTEVKGGGAAAQFEDEWVFDGMIDKIGPGNTDRIGTGNDHDTFQHLHFKAPSSAMNKTELLEVVIDGFDADLDPLHNRNNGGGSGTWSKRVVAS